MRDDETDVIVQQWHAGPGPDAIDTTSAAVGAFAGRHGMSSARRAATVSAVGAILRHAAAGTSVDAATDGEWLSIVVHDVDVRDDDPGPALAVATAVADRVEWPDGRGSVVLEIAVGSRARGRGLRRRPPRPRRSCSAQRAAHVAVPRRTPRC